MLLAIPPPVEIQMQLLYSSIPFRVIICTYYIGITHYYSEVIYTYYLLYLHHHSHHSLHSCFRRDTTGTTSTYLLPKVLNPSLTKMCLPTITYKYTCSCYEPRTTIANCYLPLLLLLCYHCFEI